MGGKTATSSSQVSVPPQVLANYQAAYGAASKAASAPFQQYGGQFVAPVNATQETGIAGTTANANDAAAYYSAATPIAQQAATTADVGPLTGSQINQYLSPYLSDVLGSTEALENQQNQQAMAGQTGNAIESGAFGGDRSGIAAANLQQQQDIASANIYSGIANEGYNTALSTAQQQQQTQLQSSAQEQAAAQTLAGLGAGAQTAALQGSAAELSAGQVAQTTQQAQDTALYNQFLQQQSYPFQTAQFLADVAEGTGSLSGSTTTTTQPGGFFSDERLKEDIEPIGKTYDGQEIIRFHYKGDPRKVIGLSAQKVERKHPDAVGLARGYKTVDYGKATDDAAERGHFASGGLAGRTRYADGGSPPIDISQILQAQQQMYAQMQQHTGSGIPAASGRSYQLPVTNAPSVAPQNGANNVMQAAGLGQKGYQLYNHFNTPAAPQTLAHPSPGLDANGNLVSSDSSGLAAGTDSSAASAATPAAADVAPAAADVTPAATDVAPAAAEVAAPAAADAATVAAPAAADAAGTAATGAAAGALGAGAAGAGADAATALAAEAALADAGLVAAAAAKRGGRQRAGLAAGGMPYEGDGAGTPYQTDDGTLYIPNEQNTNALKAAPAAGKQPTGLQSLMALGDPNQMGTTFGTVFSNQAVARGGVAGARHGYATDGTVDPDADPNTPPGLSTQIQQGQWLEQHIPDWIKSAGHFIGQFADPSGASEMASAPSPAPASASAASPAPIPTPAPKPVTISPHRQPQGLGATPVATAASPPAASPAPSPAPAAGLGGAPAGAAPAPAPSPISLPKPSLADFDTGMGASSAPASAPSAPSKQSIWDKALDAISGLKDSDLTKSQNLIPILAGIAAMGTTPTRSLGVALASGLGAGVQAYLPTQEAQAKIAQTQAQTGLTSANEWSKIQEIAGNQNMVAIPGPAPNGGKSFNTSDGKTYHLEVKGSLFPSGGQAPAPSTYKYLGQQGQAEAENDMHRLTLSGPTPGEAEASKDAESNVANAAANAYSQGGTLNQLTTELEKIPANGVVSSGPTSAWRTALVGRANDIMRSIGPSIGIDPTPYLIGPDELGDVTASNKLGGFFRLAATKNADQKSLGALEETASMIPSPSIPKDQAAKVLAGMYVDKQRALDESNYVDEYKRYLDQTHPGMSQNYLVQNAREAFRKDHPDTEYGAAKEGLHSLLTTNYKDGRPVFPDFYAGKVPAQYADKLTGVPGISRYFLNQ